ncbi:MAG: DUF2341 domain-containing protein [Patescibacteria group bacterium]
MHTKHMKITIGVTAIIVGVFVLWSMLANFNGNDPVSIDGQRVQLQSAKEKTSLLAFTPAQANDVAPERVGETTLLYRDVYDFTDISYTTGDFFVKEDIILKEPGHPTSFKYDINLSDYTYILNGDGSISVFTKGSTAENDKQYTILAPFLIDANGIKSDHTAVSIEVRDDAIIYTPEKRWLLEHTYPIVLDPSVEITILTIQSHPQQGDDWAVRFTTEGRADLYIIPDDQATVDDDVFTSLTCDGQEHIPEILEGDVIFYENWSCSGEAEVVHYTAVAGKHTLRFEFGGQVGYAYNDPGDPWWNASWTYRKEITIQSSQVDYTGTFPVLVTTTDAVLADTGNGGKVEFSAGTDIAFANDSGTLLDFEREYYDNTTGELVAWVEASINSGANTSIYVYYGNSGASDQADIEGTWDSNYMMVQHLQETSGTHFDSTSNNNDSTSVTVTTQGGSGIGQIGPADSFDGTNDTVSIADSASLDIGNAGTIQAWINTDDVSATGGAVSDWRDDIDDPNGSSPGEYSGMDMTIVGDRIYYGAALCGPDVFEYASSTLRGNELTWTTGTAATGCGGGEGHDLAIDSDGDYIWYAVLGNNGTTGTFYYATSTLDHQSFSAWHNPANPTGVGGDDGSGIDMTIDGNTVYFSTVLLNGTAEDIEVATINLDGSGWSGWDETPPVPDGGGAGENCSIASDTNGTAIFYSVLCHSNSTSQYQSATSTMSASTFNSWSNDPDPSSAGSSEHNFHDIVLVGDTTYHAAYMYTSTGPVNDYQVAESSFNNISLSAWTSEQDAAGLPNEGGSNEYSTASVTSDGKTLYYAALGASDDIEGFLYATSTVTSHPFISKENAYEILQTGGGFVFDWTGAPRSFATSTPANTYKHIVVTHDGSTMSYYVDGVLQRTQNVTADFETNTNILSIGSAVRVDALESYFDGEIDEVRVSNSARSATWITTEFNNQSDVASFISIGSEETDAGGGNTAPTITSVAESEDPIAANRDLYWAVDWNDTDAGDMVKVVVCSTNTITTSTLACAATKYCESPVYTNRDPETLCYYKTQTADIGTLNYSVYVCDDSGDGTTDCSDPSSGTVTVQEQTPSSPTILLTQNMPNPVNIATTTPILSAIYNDSNIDDIANKYCVHVNTQSDFLGTDMWISDGAGCGTGNTMTNCTQGNRCQDIHYKGTALTLGGTVYYWRINYWDDSGNISASSTTGNFTMSSGDGSSSPRGVRMRGFDLKGGTRVK